MIGFRIRMVALLLVFSGLAVAEKETQMIMQFDGDLTVDAKGVVKTVSFKNVKNVKEDTLENFIIESIKSWPFYPMEINGKPVEATTGFSLTLKGIFLYGQKLKQLEFSDFKIQPSPFESEIESKSLISKRSINEIRYPSDALNLGAEAIITLALDVAADGSVKNAAVLSTELINAVGLDSKLLANRFGKSALQAAKQSNYSKDQLAQVGCINGCIATSTINFMISNSGGWKSYQLLPVAPIPWVIAAELKDLDDVQKSQLVRLKDDPTGKPIDISG